ncbi:MAG: FtsX-like permease family protein [Bifidobacteriaceae bacterium]|nr:FtsX-like permease family protein [Bifidobacteriaceae bacterium]
MPDKGGPAVGRDQARRAMWWRMLVRSLTRRRSRVLIAMLAVAIGATTLTALATLAVDIPRQMGREMRSAGANVVVIADDDGPALTGDVLPMIDDVLAGQTVVGSAAYRYLTVRINSQPYLAAGTDVDAARDLNPYWAVDGALPKVGEMLVGTDIAEWIDLDVGDTVTVTASPPDGDAGAPDEDGSATAEYTRDLVVSGILRSGGSEDALVVMDAGDLDALAGTPGLLDTIEYSIAASGERIDQIASAIEAAVPGANAGPVTRLTRTDADVLGMLQSLLGLIAVIVLGLTMIGVSTTMMAVVAERRTEIALRLALGARGRSITGEFLAEAMVLGGTGGVLGAAAGYGVAQAISVNVFHRPVAFVPLLAVAAVAVSVHVTRLASQWPVRRAAQIDPAVVLKGE